MIIRTIRFRLMSTIVGSVLATWLATLAVAIYFSQQTLSTIVDRQLLQYMDLAENSMQLIFMDPEGESFFWERLSGDDSHLIRYVTDRAGRRGTPGLVTTNVWVDGYQIVSHQQGVSFPAPAGGFPRLVDHFFNYGSGWRVVYRFNDSLNIWLAVGMNVPAAANKDYASELFKPLIPLFVVLPVLLVMVWIGINRSLRPLRKLTRSVDALDVESLEPIKLDELPSELQSTVDSVNELLLRLRRALESEHRFTANAAHELQTPLASIKAEVQHHQRIVQSSDTRQMLARIAKRVDRATEMVTQLLVLARVESGGAPTSDESVALDLLIFEVVADLGTEALSKNLTINVDHVHSLAVLGNHTWLQILLQNLLGNAVKFSLEGSEILITLKQVAGRAALRVENNCANIPESLVPLLSERFVTVKNENQAGSGLGLSIVERITELHGGRFMTAYEGSEQSFAVTIELPCG